MDQYRMIDANDISVFLKGFVFFIGRLAGYILLSVKKYFAVAILVFAAVVGGFVFYQRSRPVCFESTMACKFNNLSRRVYGEMTEKLNALVASGSYATLSQTLGITEKQARSVIGIQANNIKGKPIIEDFAAGQYPFFITLRASDRSVFLPFQEGIVRYLNGSPFRALRNNLDRDKYYEKVNMLSKDLGLIDTLVLSYASSLRGAEGTDSASIANITGLIAYKEVLEDKMLDQKWKAGELKQSVEVMHGFLPPDRPVPVRSRYSLSMAIMLGSCLAVLAALLCRALPAAGQSIGKQP